ncbi:hypothetical protein RQV60_003634 [Vibrio cholerae]|nr:hypothetical protein [Vibrio cholerae]
MFKYLTVSNYNKKTFLLSLCLIFGCETTEQLNQEREASVLKMDNLDICYNLGKQSDFEYWKLIKEEQFRRQTVVNTWDISESTCNEAMEMGKVVKMKMELRKQKTSEEIKNSIDSATKSISDGYKNAASVYGSYAKPF